MFFDDFCKMEIFFIFGESNEKKNLFLRHCLYKKRFKGSIEWVCVELLMLTTFQIHQTGSFFV